MKFIWTVIFIVITFQVKSQQKQQTFNFVVANKIIIDNVTGLYQGKSFEFSYVRNFYKKKCFREIGLFAGADSNNLFKTKNKYWYIKQNKNWQLFYSPRKKVTPKIKFSGLWYILKPENEELLNGIPCVVYDVIPLNNNVSGSIKYWFSPIYGII